MIEDLDRFAPPNKSRIYLGRRKINPRFMASPRSGTTRGQAKSRTYSDYLFRKIFRLYFISACLEALYQSCLGQVLLDDSLRLALMALTNFSQTEHRFA